MLKDFLETVDSSIVYQKNWKMSYLPLLLWVISLKNKVFRAKIFPIRLIQKLGVSFDCSKLYKIHFWLLSEKTSRFNFCRVSEGVTFFSILDLPLFNITRMSYISQAKSMLRLFKYFFNENFKYFFLETVDSSIRYQKNWKTSYLPSLLWVLSLKNKVFRAKIFPIRLIQKLGVSFDCSKLYKIHFWLLSEKTSRFNFCRVSGGVTFFSSFGFTNHQYQSIVLYFTGEEYAAFF